MVFSADALRKMTRAKNSMRWCVSASITRTPVARPVAGSVRMLCAIECGRRVRRPVAAAAGSVDELLEKYAPYGQPRWQRFRAWHWPRPLCGRVSTATRLLIRRRSGKRACSCSRRCFSMQFISNGGISLPSGSCGRPAFSPLTPMNDSTWSYQGSMSL